MKYKVLLNLVQALEYDTDHENDVFSCTIIRGSTYHAYCEQRDTQTFSGAMQIEGPSSLPTRITLCVNSIIRAELGRYFPWVTLGCNHFELLSHPDHRMDFDSTPRSMEWHVAPRRLGMRFFVWFTKGQATGFWVPGVARNDAVPPPFCTPMRADVVYQPCTRRPWCLYHRRHTEGHFQPATWGVPRNGSRAAVLSHVQCQRVVADLQKRGCVVEIFLVGSSMCVIYCSSNVSEAHPHLNMQRVPFPPAWEYGFVGAGGYTTARPFWYAFCSVWKGYGSIAYCIRTKLRTITQTIAPDFAKRGERGREPLRSGAWSCRYDG